MVWAAPAITAISEPSVSTFDEDDVGEGKIVQPAHVDIDGGGLRRHVGCRSAGEHAANEMLIGPLAVPWHDQPANSGLAGQRNLVNAHPWGQLAPEEGRQERIGIERLDLRDDRCERVAAAIGADVDRGPARRHKPTQQGKLGLEAPALLGDLVGKVEPSREEMLEPILQANAQENRPWQCLNFLPEPHGQASLRPTLPQLVGSDGLRAAAPAAAALVPTSAGAGAIASA